MDELIEKSTSKAHDNLVVRLCLLAVAIVLIFFLYEKYQNDNENIHYPLIQASTIKRKL